jgi:hypothetical protein
MKQAERLERLEEQMLLLSRKKPWYKRAWDWINGIGVIVGVPSSVIGLAILFWPQVNDPDTIPAPRSGIRYSRRILRG